MLCTGVDNVRMYGSDRTHVPMYQYTNVSMYQQQQRHNMPTHTVSSSVLVYMIVPRMASFPISNSSWMSPGMGSRCDLSCSLLLLNTQASNFCSHSTRYHSTPQQGRKGRGRGRSPHCAMCHVPCGSMSCLSPSYRVVDVTQDLAEPSTFPPEQLVSLPPPQHSHARLLSEMLDELRAVFSDHIHPH